MCAEHLKKFKCAEGALEKKNKVSVPRKHLKEKTKFKCASRALERKNIQVCRRSTWRKKNKVQMCQQSTWEKTIEYLVSIGELLRTQLDLTKNDFQKISLYFEFY